MPYVEHLDVDYRGVVAVEDVSFCVFPGQMIGVIGETLAQCDSLLLLNKHIIADGSMKEVVTTENLQRAYGNNILFLNRESKSV